MKIDFATLAFGYTIKAGGGTPNWATSLGQGKEYRINDNTDINELLKGMVYSSVSLSKISSKIGKGGRSVNGDAEDSPIIMASLFSNVYINDTQIKGGKYILLITRDTSKSHEGRLRFKYGPSNEYNDGSNSYSNETFWQQAKSQMGLADDSCFFVYNIRVRNQNELILRTIVVNKYAKVEYQNISEQHSEWDKLIEKDEELIGYMPDISENDNIQTSDSECNDKIMAVNFPTPDSNAQGETNLKNCLEVALFPIEDRIHSLNTIIYGAPGTGKTYLTPEYALSIIDGIKIDKFKTINTNRKENIIRYKEYLKKGQIVFTTFHQNYGYEDFIQGLRPYNENDTISFKIFDGVFKKIADRALNDAKNKYVIIIDEINRANISKVFGELITLIEPDKRWGELNETCVTLQSGEPFAVPNNLYIIGTMNSADKSISLIDAALRRRFDFIEQKPDSSCVPNGVLRKFFDDLNSNLVSELDSTDLLIGHSYFLNKQENELCDIINNNIIPLLYEYFYDNRKKVASIIEKAIWASDASIEIVNEKVSRLKVKEKV